MRAGQRKSQRPTDSSCSATIWGCASSTAFAARTKTTLTATATERHHEVGDSRAALRRAVHLRSRPTGGILLRLREFGRT